MAFHCVWIGESSWWACTEMVNYCLLFNCLPGLILFHHLFYCSWSKICLDKRRWCTKCLIETGHDLKLHYYRFTIARAELEQSREIETRQKGEEEKKAFVSFHCVFYFIFFYIKIAKSLSLRGAQPPSTPLTGGCAPCTPPGGSAPRPPVLPPPGSNPGYAYDQPYHCLCVTFSHHVWNTSIAGKLLQINKSAKTESFNRISGVLIFTTEPLKVRAAPKIDAPEVATDSD